MLHLEKTQNGLQQFIEKIMTPWGELKIPKFQSHAVYISQDKKGNFINENEAHFICAILNSQIVEKFILNSSDSRSFKVRPQVYIPKYDATNIIHKKLLELSIKAHKFYNNKDEMLKINNTLDTLVIKLKNV